MSFEYVLLDASLTQKLMFEKYMLSCTTLFSVVWHCGIHS